MKPGISSLLFNSGWLSEMSAKDNSQNEIGWLTGLLKITLSNISRCRLFAQKRRKADDDDVPLSKIQVSRISWPVV